MNTRQPLIADSKDSTFWWHIHLDRTNALNSVDLLTGYSKFRGQDEAADKKLMLLRKIVTLHRNGYFDRSRQIDIYMRVGPFINKAEDRLIMQLTPKMARLHESILEHTETVEFINNFYDYMKAGKDPAALLPKPKANFSKDDYFNVEKQSLRIGVDTLKLNAYTARLMKNGHPVDAVVNFFNQYKAKYHL